MVLIESKICSISIFFPRLKNDFHCLQVGRDYWKINCNYVLYLYHSIIVSIRFGFCVIRFPIIFVI